MSRDSHTPATDADITALVDAQILDSQSAQYAAQWIYRPVTSSLWAFYGRTLLFGLGLLHVLLGVIFFFAANWAYLSKWSRLSLVGIGLVISVGCAWWRHGTLVARLLLTAATVLVGVFMAVYGQVYQTGADAWSLFATWAALSVIWVAVAKFWPLFFLWSGVVQMAVFTFGAQASNASAAESSLACFGVCTVLYIGAVRWWSGQTRWVNRVCVANCTALLVLPCVSVSHIYLVCLAGTAFVLWAWRSRRIIDLFVPSMALCLAMVCALHWLVSVVDISEPIFIGMFCVVQVAVFSAWLRREWQRRGS